jgi:hypothetical protein
MAFAVTRIALDFDSLRIGALFAEAGTHEENLKRGWGRRRLGNDQRPVPDNGNLTAL